MNRKKRILFSAGISSVIAFVTNTLLSAWVDDNTAMMAILALVIGITYYVLRQTFDA